MPAETFHFSFTAAAVLADKALCALFNGETTDLRRDFEIVQLAIREVPFPASMSNTLVGTVDVARVAGYSGGSPVTPVATNEGASLPAQVTAATQVDAIDAPAAVRSFSLNQPGMGWSSGGLFTWLQRAGAKIAGQPYRNPGVLWHAGQGSVLQSLELRQGEGIAVRPSTNPPAPLGWLCEIEFEVGGSTWIVPAELYPPEGHQAHVVLFNGVGSGVVLKVRAINVFSPGFFVYDDATANASAVTENSTLRIVRIREAFGGVPLSAQPANGAHPVPAAFALRRGSLRNELNVQLVDGLDPASDLGYPGTNGPAVRRINAFRNLRMRLASVDLTTGFVDSNFAPARSLRQGIDIRSDGARPIRLRPQEGIALLVNSASPLCSYLIEGTVLHQPPPATPSGGRRPVPRVLGA